MKNWTSSKKRKYWHNRRMQWSDILRSFQKLNEIRELTWTRDPKDKDIYYGA